MGLMILDLESLQSLKDYAESHPFSRTDMIDRSLGTVPQPGDDPAYTRLLPPFHLVVFSIDQHPEGWMRHASVSVMREGKKPHPAQCIFIIKALGFENPLKECHLYWENSTALNILEPYNPAT